MRQALLPCPALLLLLACSPDRPEVLVRRAFDGAVQAVEKGDAGAAVEVLDEGFRGPDGMTKAEARGYLTGWFRQEKVGVTVVVQRVEVRGDRADQEVEVLLTARGQGALLPQDGSRRSFRLRWIRAGRTWRVRELRTEGA